MTTVRCQQQIVNTATNANVIAAAQQLVGGKLTAAANATLISPPSGKANAGKYARQ